MKSNNARAQITETGSISGHSKSSKSSGRLTVRSSVGSSSATNKVNLAAAHAQAEAQAARARLAYAEKEMNIKIERARLEATLDVLNLQKEADVAIAKAEVMGYAAAKFDVVEPNEELSFIPVAITPQQKVSEYIKKHNPDEPLQRQSDSYNQHYKNHPQKSTTTFEPLPIKQYSEHYKFRPLDGIISPQNESITPHFPNFVPQLQQTFNSNASNADNSTANIAKFLAKSQLVIGGLTKYDDKPEDYLGWKITFQSAIAELNLTANEEINLLIKWLGPESSEHARRMKAVNLRNPTAGLGMIWKRLDECYGSPEAIENSLFSRIENFPKFSNKEPHKLRELSDLLSELEAAKLDGFLPGLSYLDTARGISPILGKLPFPLQEKWTTVGSKYKEDYKVTFPPFSFFSEFVKKEAKARNDPSFATTQSSSINSFVNYRNARPATNYNIKPAVTVHKTEISAGVSATSKNEREDMSHQCPIHHKPHQLKNCRGFRAMLLEERKKFIKDNNICYKCLASTSHRAKDCNFTIKCTECDSERHLSALHPGPAPKAPTFLSPIEHGGEQARLQETDVTATCTEVCGKEVPGKSCSKICLVHVYPEGQRHKSKTMYAIIDDQSNLSLAKTEFFDSFNIQSRTEPYTLKTCAGVTQTSGRRAIGYTVETFDGKTSLSLPTLIECNAIPNNREEIPTPEVAKHHQHLSSIAREIPPLDSNAEILLLIGRNLLRAHKVIKQICGGHNDPYAHKLDLGWVIVGDVCLGGAHRPNEVSALKTHVLDNGRPSYLRPCTNCFTVKEDLSYVKADPHHLHLHKLPANFQTETLGDNVFRKSDIDNQLAPSVEDVMFFKKMEEIFKDKTNSWVAPLPFRSPRPLLPDNRAYAYQRLVSLRRTLEKKQDMKKHFVEFVQKMLNNKHAELAPPCEIGKERWYLPIFGIYHPQKPGKIRVVFDSSAKFEGLSLNDVLLKGPDLNNTLLGVLLRFRKEPVAITADIEQMFYSFVVRTDHRDFLRFLWYRDNDLNKDVVDYRMSVHVFGNSPSPAVALIGLRMAAKEAEEEYGSDARQFVEKDFYVDDALKSFPTETDAINMVQRVQSMLAQSNLRLHKINSNRENVVNAFPPEDRAREMKNIDLSTEQPPIQRSLGVIWNTMSDTFTFHVPKNEKPYTRRGVLSVINSLFDPLGFLAPVTIQGRLLLRQLSSGDLEWDSALPQDMFNQWRRWEDSLQELKTLHVSRTYVKFSVSQSIFIELCVFADASVKAISAVAYLKLTHKDGQSEVGFLMGKSKLAPVPELTIPRLELCAAVLAVELSEVLKKELDLKINRTTFYTDSKVVLGYINNQQRRFYVYVNNRVQRIKQSSLPEQWKYVPTEHNPADHGSRSVPAGSLSSTTWLCGPAFLLQSNNNTIKQGPFDLLNPTSDVEIRPDVTALTTTTYASTLGSSRFERFSRWTVLVKTIAYLQHVCQSFEKSKRDDGCVGWHLCPTSLTAKALTEAETTIIKCVQQEVYAVEMAHIKNKRSLPRNSSLFKLHPFVDKDGLLRVGGRLSESKLSSNETNPLLIPGKHDIATLLIRHHHAKVQHQGRHFTEGAVRASGLWIVGAKRSISSVIHKCVICRKLRGRMETQVMADLPAERLQTDPPFSFVGLDVFGPWEVMARRTKGGQANSKRWAVLFTCMSTRAIHIEVIETLSTSTFINALRRFFAIRGPVRQLRSDCGTNFIGASKELKLEPPKLGERAVDAYLREQRCSWVFNPPHSSHMGGCWERMIGVVRRILDSMLLKETRSKLTHEILTTFMAEVTAIVNARPLVPVSSDPEAPQILTPSTLLTQKFHSVSAPPGDFTGAEMHKQQWKRVQALADTFWSRWQKEYLGLLQCRRKWQSIKPNLKEGDVVLLRDKQLKRNDWPMGVIEKTLPSKDGAVRKVEVKVAIGNKTKTFYRPVSECIVLLSHKM